MPHASGRSADTDLKVAAGDLDRGYLSQWAAWLGATDLLDRALAEAAV